MECHGGALGGGGRIEVVGVSGGVARSVGRGAVRDVDEGGDGKTGQGRFGVGAGVVIGGE